MSTYSNSITAIDKLYKEFLNEFNIALEELHKRIEYIDKEDEKKLLRKAILIINGKNLLLENCFKHTKEYYWLDA